MMVKPKLLYEFGEGFLSAIEGRTPRTPAEGVKTMGAPAEHGVYVRCEAIAPKSAIGRRVTLWIPPEAVDLLLLELRNNARDRRMTTVRAGA